MAKRTNRKIKENEELKQLKKEISDDVKEQVDKVKGLGTVKLIILAILLVGTVCTFIFYNDIFAADSFFYSNPTGSGFVNGLLRAMPPFFKSVQIVSITLLVITIILAVLKRFCGKKSQRGKTVTLLICNLIRWITAIVLAIVVLAVWGVNTGALITGAGVLTLVVGLGMQSLISDVVAGLFIVFENEFNVGDIITVDGFRGTVVSIGIRTTKLEAQGNIKIINNSDLRNVLNQTVKPSVAYAEIGIDYGQLKEAESVIEKSLASLEIDGAISPVVYEGVKELGKSEIVLYFSANCAEGDKFAVQRKMNKKLFLMFDENGVNIPYEHIVIMQEEENGK